jgi:tight adherence protein B
MDALQILLNPIVLSVIAFLAVLLLFIGLGRAERASDEVIEDRLDRYGSRADLEVDTGPRKRRSAMDGLDDMMANRGFGATLQVDLAQADLKLRVSEFVILNIGSIILFFFVAKVIFNSVLLALVFSVVGFFAPRVYLNFRKSRRIRAFNDQLGDTITLLANSLRSGYTIVQSMNTVAEQLPDPMSSEFYRVTQEISLGLHYEEALNNMLRRVPSDDLDLLITAVNIQGRVGGNLAEILDTIGQTIRERVRIQGEIRVLTAQQMLSGYILSFLPIALGLVLFLINPPYIKRLFTDPCGWAMVGLAFVMIAIGFTIIRKIVNIEV